MRRGLRRALLYITGLVMVGAAGLGAVRIWQQQTSTLAATRAGLARQAARGPRVQVVAVAASPAEREIHLLGDTRPLQTVTLYGKVSGYVQQVRVDRGDRVHAGDLLAMISSAETDRVYDSAVSDMQNKQTNMVRARDLAAHGVGSQQTADQTQADFRMAIAAVAAAATMKSYEEMRAPFDGVVTARFVDTGALVQNAQTNETSSQPVVTISDDSRVRVDVYLSQSDVPFVHVGDRAEVTDAANEDRVMRARVARTADQLDPRTRTLFVELEVDNHDHSLVPGSFVYVTLHAPVPTYPQVPVGSLLIRGGQPFVADVGNDGVVHLRPVKVASTDGTMVSLAGGVRIGEQVAVNLPDEVADGGRVQRIDTAAGGKQVAATQTRQ
jgi:membrane fusion protein, multidrug efflux system